MSTFLQFKKAIQAQFDAMAKHSLFSVDVSKEELWETYLGSFPAGTDPMYLERTEHDCNCCKQFIRDLGKVVTVKGNLLVTIWDIKIPGFYQEVADDMATLVKSKAIANAFLHDSPKVGTDYNYQTLGGGKDIKWEHFFCKVPKKYVLTRSDIATSLGRKRSNKEVLKRSLDEISLSSAEIVLELIAQNSIYRGAEHKATVKSYVKHKKAYDKIPANNQDSYCWVLSSELGIASKIRNTVIGTLLSDISDGVELDRAVKAFEDKVAPANYKRPKTLITQSMIKKAQEKLTDLGLLDAMSRRYAVAEDLTINNVLFADRSVKPSMNIFEELSNTLPQISKQFSKVEEVSITKFLRDILPKAESLELLVENTHMNNLVSLIAPVHADAGNMLKWDNNFSWAYAGEVTDSIKERVKRAGGSVDGVLRCSLSWFNKDDLDIHLIEPNGNQIYFGDKMSKTSGKLDVDMNAYGSHSRNAVENITYSNKSKMLEGSYKLVVHNFSLRETIDVGFDVEIEYDGEIHTFHYPKPVKRNEKVVVAEFNFSKKTGITIKESIPSTQATKEVWGINTNTFQKVTMVMNSPNHWDGEETGNKHWFFMLADCKNAEKARGFFNEFLRNDLTEHRKVFEVLGAKMKTELSDDQLSGLGFSSTQNNSVTCRVSGKTVRTIKIKF